MSNSSSFFAAIFLIAVFAGVNSAHDDIDDCAACIQLFQHNLVKEATHGTKGQNFPHGEGCTPEDEVYPQTLHCREIPNYSAGKAHQYNKLVHGLAAGAREVLSTLVDENKPAGAPGASQRTVKKDKPIPQVNLFATAFDL